MRRSDFAGSAPNNPALRRAEFPAPAPPQTATDARTRCACHCHDRSPPSCRSRPSIPLAKRSHPPPRAPGSPHDSRNINARVQLRLLLFEMDLRALPNRLSEPSIHRPHWWERRWSASAPGIKMIHLASSWPISQEVITLFDRFPVARHQRPFARDIVSAFQSGPLETRAPPSLLLGHQLQRCELFLSSRSSPAATAGSGCAAYPP